MFKWLHKFLCPEIEKLRQARVSEETISQISCSYPDHCRCKTILDQIPVNQGGNRMDTWSDVG